MMRAVLTPFAYMIAASLLGAVAGTSTTCCMVVNRASSSKCIHTKPIPLQPCVFSHTCRSDVPAVPFAVCGGSFEYVSHANLRSGVQNTAVRGVVDQSYQYQRCKRTLPSGLAQTLAEGRTRVFHLRRSRHTYASSLEADYSESYSRPLWCLRVPSS